MVDQGELDTMGGEASAARPAAARRTPPGAFRGTDGRSVVVGLDLGGTKLRGAIGDAAGEPDAKSVIDATLRGIAIGLGAVVALLDPGRIVIGGGIGARPGVADALGAYLRRLVPSPCEVVTSRLGARAGVVGALAYARAAALQAVATEGPDA